MSNTCVAERPSALDDMPWIEIDADLENVFQEFVTAADRRIGAKNAPKVPAGNMAVLAEPAADEAELDEIAAERLRARDRAAFEDLLLVQDLPLIDDEADAEAYEEATSGHAPPLADRLPDE
jgi:hypothetical protein